MRPAIDLPTTPALPVTAPSIEQISINTIRTLSMDGVQAANSGHPGTPMALAPVAYSLWQQFLRFDPQDPVWPNRDRFVLSIGHASMRLVVSMPSWELFDDQDKDYRESVLPPQVRARVSVEAASDFGWSKYTGSEGCSICIETFGASAPLKQLLKKFGFSVDHVVTAAKDQIALHKPRN